MCFHDNQILFSDGHNVRSGNHFITDDNHIKYASSSEQSTITEVQ